MSGKHLNLSMVSLVLIFLSGCVTAPVKPDESQIRALENQVSSLEAEVLKRDSEIINLSRALDKERQERGRLLEAISKQEKEVENLTETIQQQKKKSRGKTYYTSIMKMQTALRNAGFEPGIIDGKMGPRTRDALREFQKAHGLPADGRLDRQTWDLLQQYMETKK